MNNKVVFDRETLYAMYQDAMLWTPPAGMNPNTPLVTAQGRQVVDNLLNQVRQQRQVPQSGQVL